MCQIVTFNVQNLFSETADPAITKAGEITAMQVATRLKKLALTIDVELGLPHILAVQEVGDADILARLAALVNSQTGSNYQAAAPATSDRRGTRLGFLWDEHRVQLANMEQMAGQGIETTFGAASPSPGREPLIGKFHIANQEMIVVNVHLKSNYLPAESSGAEAILAASAAQRMAQAQVLRQYVDAQLSIRPEAWLLVCGDFNDDALTPESPLAYLAGGEPPLVNLMATGAELRPFSFWRNGQPELLDYFFASPAMADMCTAVHIPHLNSIADPAFADDPKTVYRASDHDPVIACFRLPA